MNFVFISRKTCPEQDFGLTCWVGLDFMERINQLLYILTSHFIFMLTYYFFLINMSVRANLHASRLIPQALKLTTI